MQIRMYIIILVAALSLNSQLFAAEQLKGEIFLASPPKGWVLGHKDKQGNVVTFEYIPPTESINQWTEMVTMQTMLGLNNISPETFLARIAQLSKDFCVGHGIEKVSSRSINGYESLGMVQGCGTNKATQKGEVTIFRVLRGKDSLYVIQKAWKTKPFDPSVKLPVEINELNKWIQYLTTADVCDTRKGTCPSGIGERK
jgi:hypothetical protein